MSSSSQRIRAAFAFAVVAFIASGPASADWPISRHDTRRTGVSATGSDIKKPAAYWRARLGGALSETQIYVGDVNKDGEEDVLFVTGGQLTLADIHGNVLWRTASRGFGDIVNVVDLDLDGQIDVVVGTSSGISVVNAVTGKIEWDEPAGEIGSIGAIRIGDVDGDGRPDVWLDTCGCCAIESGSPGVVYSFAGGAGAPVKLGTPPARGHCGATSDTMADMNGDGQLEMISMDDDTATMFGADGTVLATSDVLPGRAFGAQCEATDLDGQPGDELICFTNTVYAGGGERGLFVLAYHPAETPALKLLWNVEASDAAGDAQAPTELTADLAGDGHREAIVSGSVNGTYTTFVLDGATGTQLATVPGIAAGDVQGGAPGQRWLLVGAGDTLNAVAFASQPPSLTQIWALPGQRAYTSHDWVGAMQSGFAESLLTPDLNGDARPDVVLISASEPTILSGYDTSHGTPAMLGQYAIDAGIGASAAGPSDGFAAKPNVFVARTDGFVALLDGTLSPINLGNEGSVTLPGMYVGGYCTGPGAVTGFGHAPIAGKLTPGDAADAVLVVDSRGDLVRIDPTGATNVAPAKVSWRLADSFGAGMQPAGAGPATIGVFRRRHPVTDPPQYVIASISTDGQELASLPLPRPPLWDVLPGDFVGDGSIAFVGLDLGGALMTDITAMSADGTQLWQQSLVATAGTQPFAAGDWEGDGALDVASVINVAHVYSGKTGTEIATGVDPLSYFMPILADVTGGSQLDMVLQGGYVPVRALGHDLTSLWVSDGPPQPYPYGSLVSCPSASVLIEGSFSTPAGLNLTQASGASAGATTSFILASGASYPDAASASAANATLGQLTDVAVSTDLDGSGKGPTALVGSTDGYLYAVDACTGALRWALAFGVPVGSPIVADSDGDGKDEIFVSVADGYLYALENEVLPAPGFVWDTDPPHGITDMDVNSIQTVSTLYAKWGAVPGAASYEVAVVNAGGAYVTSPSWVGVGAVTSSPIPGLPLVDGAEYFVGVRAVSPAGRSPDTPSNGVVVHPPTGTGGAGGSGGGATVGTGGAGAGSGGAPPYVEPLTGRACTCSAPGSGGGGGRLGLFLAAAAVLARRAARRRRRTA